MNSLRLIYGHVIRLTRRAKNAVYKGALPRFFDPLMARFVKPYTTLRMVILGMTYECQARCCHCGVSTLKRDLPELSKDEIDRVLAAAARLAVKSVYFFGGEPLLRPDFLEVVGSAARHGLNAEVSTNGLNLDENTARALKAAGNITKVWISIDSPDPAAHDMNRGVDGAFQCALDAVENCHRAGVSPLFSYYLTGENLRRGDLEKVIALGKELRVKGIRIFTPILCGELSGRSDLRLTREEQEKLDSLLEPGFVFLENDEYGRNVECVAWSRLMVYVSCYGDVQPCVTIPYSFGSIREEPLEKIVGRMW